MIVNDEEGMMSLQGSVTQLDAEASPLLEG